jgi:hypothetical protein
LKVVGEPQRGRLWASPLQAPCSEAACLVQSVQCAVLYRAAVCMLYAAPTSYAGKGLLNAACDAGDGDGDCDGDFPSAELSACSASCRHMPAPSLSPTLDASGRRLASQLVHCCAHTGRSVLSSMQSSCPRFPPWNVQARCAEHPSTQTNRNFACPT